MARPSSFLTWATSGSKLDPGAGRKATGFLPGETLPAQWLNWLLNNVGQWLTWINSYVPAKNEANTFSAKQTLGAGVDVVGDGSFTGTVGAAGGFQGTGVIDTAAQFVVVNGPGSVDGYRLIQEAPSYEGDGMRRIYAYGVGAASGLAITINAYWTGSAWARDNTGLAATMLVMTGDAPPRLLTMPTIGGTWRGYADLGMAPVAMGRISATTSTASLVSSKVVEAGFIDVVSLFSMGTVRVALDGARIGSGFHVQIQPINLGIATPYATEIIPGTSTFDVKARATDGSAFAQSWAFYFWIYLSAQMAF